MTRVVNCNKNVNILTIYMVIHINCEDILYIPIVFQSWTLSNRIEILRVWYVSPTLKYEQYIYSYQSICYSSSSYDRWYNPVAGYSSSPISLKPSLVSIFCDAVLCGLCPANNFLICLIFA